MKYTFVKMIGAALAILMLTVFSQVLVYGQEAKEESSSDSSKARERTIEGVWRIQITPIDCQTRLPFLPFTIPGLLTYHQGGTMSTTVAIPGGPALRSPGHGVWSRRNGNSFKGSFVFLLFNPDGTFAGREEGTQNIQLNRRDNIFIDNTFRIFDTNDNLIASGCATIRGIRFE